MAAQKARLLFFLPIRMSCMKKHCSYPCLDSFGTNGCARRLQSVEKQNTYTERC